MSERVTPVPIPNTEVKPLSADDSSNAKVGRCLDYILRPKTTRTSGLFFCQFTIRLIQVISQN